jgi:hypothetical protein
MKRFILAIKLHYPMPLYMYSLKKHLSIYEFKNLLKKLSQETIIIPMDNWKFISLDEIEFNKNLKLDSVFVPKGEVLSKVLLGILQSMSIYRYFLPMLKVNPISKRLINRDEKGTKNWKLMLKYISLIKNKYVVFKHYQGDRIETQIYEIRFEDKHKLEKGDFVKVRGKPLYGTILEVDDGKVYVDFGHFAELFENKEILKIVFDEPKDLNEQEETFIIKFLIKNINSELIKLGFEICYLD